RPSDPSSSPRIAILAPIQRDKGITTAAVPRYFFRSLLARLDSVRGDRNGPVRLGKVAPKRPWMIHAQYRASFQRHRIGETRHRADAQTVPPIGAIDRH